MNDDPARSDLRARDARIGYAAMRIGLGVNIAMHGFSRFGNLPGFVDGLVAGFADTPLPEGLVRVFAWAIAPLEAGIGTLLVIGWQTRSALRLGAALLIALTFGVTLQQRWEVAGLQLVYLLAYSLLLAAASWNGYSLDARRRGG